MSSPWRKSCRSDRSWEFGRNLTGFLERPAAQHHADRYQDQPGDEQRRQKQKEDDAEVGLSLGRPKISTSQ